MIDARDLFMECVYIHKQTDSCFVINLQRQLRFCLFSPIPVPIARARAIQMIARPTAERIQLEHLAAFCQIRLCEITISAFLAASSADSLHIHWLNRRSNFMPFPIDARLHVAFTYVRKGKSFGTVS